MKKNRINTSGIFVKHNLATNSDVPSPRLWSSSGIIDGMLTCSQLLINQAKCTFMEVTQL